MDLNGLPILLIPAFELGEELYCSMVGEVLGDIGCLIGDFFCKLDEGDPMEGNEIKLFEADDEQASGEAVLLS